MRKGKVIYQDKKKAVFVQMDKNFQICDLLDFDKKKPFEQRIGSRVYPDLLNTFRGRPLYTAWPDLIEAIKAKGASLIQQEQS
jgi:hypothetical protein